MDNCPTGKEHYARFGRETPSAVPEERETVVGGTEERQMRIRIKQQILSMKLMANNFKISCHYETVESDGGIDKQEQKLLKKIDRATDRFLRELQKIQDEL